MPQPEPQITLTGSRIDAWKKLVIPILLVAIGIFQAGSTVQQWREEWQKVVTEGSPYAKTQNERTQKQLDIMNKQLQVQAGELKNMNRRLQIQEDRRK